MTDRLIDTRAEYHAGPASEPEADAESWLTQQHETPDEISINLTLPDSSRLTLIASGGGLARKYYEWFLLLLDEQGGLK